MAKFDRYDYRYDAFGNRRSEDELNQLEQEFNAKEKQKQRINFIYFS